MKGLFVVKDIPRYDEEISSYCYVVRAENAMEAVGIVKERTGKKDWRWSADVADNEEVWEK